MPSLGLRYHCIIDEFCAIALYCPNLIYNVVLNAIVHYCKKKALFHRTFFSLKRGSVTCMMLICLICCLLIVSVYTDIEDKLVFLIIIFSRKK